MERRNPADDRLDSLKSTQRLLSSLSETMKRRREDEDVGPREGESGEDYKARIMKTMDEAMEACSEALRIKDERVAEKIKADAVAWDSVHVDDKGRVAVGEDVSLPAREIGSTKHTPWLCGTFPSITASTEHTGAELYFEDAPELVVTYGGQTFGSAEAAFQFAKAQYFDAQLGDKEYKNALDVPAGATPIADHFIGANAGTTMSGPWANAAGSVAPLAAARKVSKGAMVAAIVASPSTGKKHTKAKAGRLVDEIEAEWLNDEEDIKAMRAVLASKFGDANPRYRDLLLATGDKPIYLQLRKTKKDDLIWEFGAREKDVTTSGLGLYGDLLMAQREALRA